MTYVGESAVEIEVVHPTEHETHEAANTDQEEWKVVALVKSYGVVNLPHICHEKLSKARMWIVNIPLWTRIRIHGCQVRDRSSVEICLPSQYR